MTASPLEPLLALGLTVRPATMHDLAAYVRLINIAANDTIGRNEVSVERYRMEFEAPGFNLDEDVRIVLTPAAELIACMEVWTHSEPPVHPWLWGRVHPDWRGRGIGTALMKWALQRAAQAMDRVPSELRVAPRAVTVSTHADAKELFQSLGMEVVRHGWRMQRDLSEPLETAAFPAGVWVRGYDHPAEMELMYRLEREAFRDHWGYLQQPFEAGFAQWRHFEIEHPKFDPTLWFLAFHRREPVGFVRCLPSFDEDEELGWVESLGVLAPWRKRRIGMGLLLHAFQTLQHRGLTRVGLGVDSENLTGATRLYEKAGMHVERQNDTYEIELRPGLEYSVVTLDTPA